MKDYVSHLIGVLAGTGTTVSFSPQVIRMYKSTDMSGVSVNMFFVHFSGVILWIVYGLLQSDVVIISFNVITAVLILLCLGRYFYVQHNRSLSSVIINQG